MVFSHSQVWFFLVYIHKLRNECWGWETHVSKFLASWNVCMQANVSSPERPRKESVKICFVPKWVLGNCLENTILLSSVWSPWIFCFKEKREPESFFWQELCEGPAHTPLHIQGGGNQFSRFMWFATLVPKNVLYRNIIRLILILSLAASQLLEHHTRRMQWHWKLTTGTRWGLTKQNMRLNTETYTKSWFQLCIYKLEITVRAEVIIGSAGNKLNMGQQCGASLDKT